MDKEKFEDCFGHLGGIHHGWISLVLFIAVLVFGLTVLGMVLSLF